MVRTAGSDLEQALRHSVSVNSGCLALQMLAQYGGVPDIFALAPPSSESMPAAVGEVEWTRGWSILLTVPWAAAAFWNFVGI